MRRKSSRDRALSWAPHGYVHAYHPVREESQSEQLKENTMAAKFASVAIPRGIAQWTRGVRESFMKAIKRLLNLTQLCCSCLVCNDGCLICFSCNSMGQCAVHKRLVSPFYAWLLASTESRCDSNRTSSVCQQYRWGASYF